MDDLLNWRIKIGCFSHRAAVSKPSKICTSSLRGVLAYTVVFLLLAGLAAELVINDPGVEMNPGPVPNQDLVTSSSKFTKQESKLLRNSKSMNHIIARLSSHRFYNKTCIDLQLKPKSLYREINIDHCPAKPSKLLLSKLKDLQTSYTKEAFSTYNEHYTEVINTCNIQKNSNIAELRKISNTDRFSYLLGIIESHYNHLISECQATKWKKINNLIDQLPRGNDSWIQNLGLTVTEKNFITNGEEICDNIVNAAASLLMRVNPLLNIQSATLDSSLLSHNPMESIHIHHNAAHHFVTTSSFGGKVILYDSMNIAPTNQLKEQITAIYSPDNTIPEFFRAPINTLQSGSVDCGIFAIAYATDLAFGNNPSDIVYDQANMREHLLQCLEKSSLLDTLSP